MLIHFYSPPSSAPALPWESWFKFPHFAAARPWNLSLSYFKAETARTPDAYYVSGKLPEVTQLVTEGPGTGTPTGLLLTPCSVSVLGFPSGLPQTPNFQFHVIRPPIKFCLQIKAEASRSVRSPVFPQSHYTYQCMFKFPKGHFGRQLHNF